MATKIDQLKNSLKKLKEKKSALDKQIAGTEKMLLNEKKKAGTTATKAVAKAKGTVKKAAGKASAAKKAVASKLSSFKKK